MPFADQTLVLYSFTLAGRSGAPRLDSTQLHIEFLKSRFRNRFFDNSIFASLDFESMLVKGHGFVEHHFPRISFGQRGKDFCVSWTVNNKRLKAFNGCVVR